MSDEEVGVDPIGAGFVVQSWRELRSRIAGVDDEVAATTIDLQLDLAAFAAPLDALTTQLDLAADAIETCIELMVAVSSGDVVDPALLARQAPSVTAGCSPGSAPSPPPIPIAFARWSSTTATAPTPSRSPTAASPSTTTSRPARARHDDEEQRLAADDIVVDELAGTVTMPIDVFTARFDEVESIDGWDDP